ncbi:GNAT family N-acetyltransferase [Arcticibacterium luteifluviistationis]|uniref:GNAT family N-acetyltransferase n=1 Tax=Arcticibacterium luteifluviistationis TaxID=1784714 RepID=A0A2Z4GI11_9BACT|nr:GNAT family N-acetyltransferase [Arcticibacterium luteifluviistationis]AWW00852.1 GNAT family N-acetyltransferase [Arcticibacterium luteifluviistationis]
MITYKTGVTPKTEDIIAVYDSSGINRPTNDFDRITSMYANSNLITSAWDGDKLVGVARSLSDGCYCCYLADLAISKDYQHQGIGKKLIEVTQEELGEKVTLILIAAPNAVDYYPKIGFEKIDAGYLIKRKS